MNEKMGWEIAQEAGEAFAAWLAEQPEEVQEMGLLEQIELYAAAQQ